MISEGIFSPFSEVESVALQASELPIVLPTQPAIGNGRTHEIPVLILKATWPAATGHMRFKIAPWMWCTLCFNLPLIPQCSMICCFLLHSSPTAASRFKRMLVNRAEREDVAQVTSFLFCLPCSLVQVLVLPDSGSSSVRTLPSDSRGKPRGKCRQHYIIPRQIRFTAGKQNTISRTLAA